MISDGKIAKRGSDCNVQEVRILWLENPPGDFIIYKFVLYLCWMMLKFYLDSCRDSFATGWFMIEM